jgi:CheY-like chemotaxis protein
MPTELAPLFDADSPSLPLSLPDQQPAREIRLGQRLAPASGIASEAHRSGLQPRPVHILIIEDNVDANEMLAMLLEMDGHTVTSCFDGGHGLQLATEGKFDIVLCDLGLPTLNGFEVVEALKAGPAAELLVIATTGYSDSAQRDLARAAGFDHYLVKPLDVAALKQLILAYAG